MDGIRNRLGGRSDATPTLDVDSGRFGCGLLPAGTLYATPTDNFSAKLRFHAWRDNDGPSAAFGYGIGNGEENYNCNPTGSTLPPLNGNNNWICGEAPFPATANIQGDFALTPEKMRLLAGTADPGLILDAAFTPPFLDGFGLERHAEQASLILDYEFANGISVSSSTAYHSNEWMALDDLDRRATAMSLGWDAVREKLKPGLRYSEIKAIGSEALRKAGYHFDIAFTPHSVGLMHTDEPGRDGAPFLVKDDLVLEENMILSVDCPVRNTGIGGSAHIEDLTLITKDGAEQINDIGDRVIVV